MRLAPGAAARVVAAAAVAGVAALVMTTHGFVGWDGTWVLQVVSRLRAGDVLYRDVFCGVPPLAFAVAAAATRLLGLELFVLRLLVAGVLALSYLVAADVLGRVTGSRRCETALAAMLVAWAIPVNVSFYQPLANLFLLAGCAAVARWQRRADHEARGARTLLALAGIAAGLSWASKQTTGTFAIVLVLTMIVIERRRARATITGTIMACAPAGLAFAGTLSAVLAPIAVSGAWNRFLDYGFLGKTTYLRVPAVSYFDQVVALSAWLRPGQTFNLLEFVRNQPLVLPLLLVPAVVALLRRPTLGRSGTALALGLAIAETASLFPRPDIDHVIAATPGFLVVLLVAWHAARSRWRGRGAGFAEASGVMVMAVTVAIRLGAGGAALASDSRTWSRVPHLNLVLLPREREASLVREAQALRRAAPDGSLFLLVPDAGLYYLASGLRNPTPFDYPLNTAFGRNGEASVAASIASGRLGRVCMATVTGPLAPERIQQAVTSHLSTTADLGICTLYEREK